jgi:hypothetical protein
MPRTRAKTNVQRDVAKVGISPVTVSAGTMTVGTEVDYLEYFTNVGISIENETVNARAGQDTWHYAILTESKVTLDFSKVTEDALPLMEIAAGAGAFWAVVTPSELGTKSFGAFFVITSAKWTAGDGLQVEELTAVNQGNLQYTTTPASASGGVG